MAAAVHVEDTSKPAEWPIYALADYDNAGLLIDASRALLSPPVESSRQRDTQTSGYRTASESARGRRPRGQASRVAASSRPRLHWWQLIEPLPADGEEALADLYRARLLKLRRHVESALSSFVSSGRATDQPLWPGSQHQAVRELNANHLSESRAPLAVDEAHLRRLSWRQRRRPARRQRRRQASERNQDDATSAHAPPNGRSQVMLAGETFSLDGDETPADASHKPTGGGDELRIDSWLRDSAAESPSRPALAHGGRSARGKYGESIVHVLLINHTNDSLIVLLVLLKLWPALLFDVFESDKFKDLNCLHLAIAYGNERLLGHLVDLARSSGDSSRAALIEQRVTGSLFRSPEAACSAEETARPKSRGIRVSTLAPSYWCDRLEHWPTANGSAHLILYDRLKSRRPETSARTGAIYLGQTPLAWAVSFEARAMFELLAGPRAGANVNSLDSQGNNCLHQLVLNNQSSWTRFLVKEHQLDLECRNARGFTPFLLACHLGRLELFTEFLELTAVEFWSYSSVCCSGYPLTSLDSLVGAASGPTAAASSAVSVILESRASSNEQKSALLSTSVVKKLLEEKWKVFARKLFYRELALQLAQLLLMIVASLLRPARLDLNYEAGFPANNRAPSRGPLAADGRALLRRTCELAVVCIAARQLWSFASEWLRHRNLLLQLTYNPLVANLVLANTLLLVCAPVRLAGALLEPLDLAGPTGALRRRLDQLEDVLLIVASPLLWSSLLFFVAAFYVTGPFVAMISHMLMRDLKQFSLIYLIFLYSFAQCIFFINRDGETSRDSSEQTPVTRWIWRLCASYLELWLELFKMTLGVYEFQPYRNSILARLFLMFFMHLIPILFNMLIAMMNNTYSLIISQSERAWSFQWARTLFALERRLSDDEKLLYLKKYSINLSSSIENSGEQTGASFVPGLMIIKRTDCTRAEARRRLVGYWQKSIKLVLDDLKKQRATC